MSFGFNYGEKVTLVSCDGLKTVGITLKDMPPFNPSKHFIFIQDQQSFIIGLEYHVEFTLH